MNWLREIGRRFSFLFHRRRFEDDLEEEMRLHQELRAESDGLHAAHRRFGNETLLREDSRAIWGWSWFDSLGQDISYAGRALKAHPAFTLTAVLSLALGIGADTAIFTILNAIMLRSLPVEDPQRLVQIRIGDNSSFTNPIWEAIRDRKNGFQGALAYGENRFDLSSGGESRFARGLFVSGDFFKVLGVPPLLGRLLTTADDQRGGGPAGPVAVISYSFWQSQYGGAPDVLGKTVRLDRHNFEIIGVTPQWFSGLDIDNVYDVAIPIGCEPLFHPDRSWLSGRSIWWLRLLGRLPPGASVPQAEAQLNSLAAEINRATLPSNWDPRDQKEYLAHSFRLRPAATGFSELRSQYQSALYTLMAVVAVVLLIACANIANLMLARAAARQREISVRLAIGAGRARLVRQLLTESLLVSALGAAVGLLFAVWGSGLLVRFFSTHRNPIELDLTPDLPVFAFTSAVAVITGLLFGIAPAFFATRVAPNSVLKENSRGAVLGSSRFRIGKALVSAQVALSLVLLVAAGLFLGTFRNLLTKGTGFNSSNILIAQVDTLEKVPKGQRVALYQTVLESFRTLPGVASAGSAIITPVSGMAWNNEVYPQGYQAKSRRDTVVWFNRVSPGYFQTVQTPMLMGRDFSNRDSQGSAKVMIVDESTARRFFGQSSPVGKTIGVDSDSEPKVREAYQVIGVVRDATYRSIREKDSGTVYLPMAQDPDAWPQMSFLLRASGSPADLPPAVRSALANVNPGLSLEFRLFDSLVAESLLQERTVALLSSFFGALALLLAMIGLYGVNAYSVTRRQAEIGIRLALGASRASVVWLVLRDVALILAAGLVLGAGLVLAVGRLVESLLYGVKPADPLTLAAAAALLAAATVFAAYLPARRASRLDPVSALRED